MLANTKNRLLKYAQTLLGGSERAQCINMANYKLGYGETIAQRIARDHKSPHHALRAMKLMAIAGAAEEINKKPGYFGTFVFEDRSCYPEA